MKVKVATIIVIILLLLLGTTVFAQSEINVKPRTSEIYSNEIQPISKSISANQNTNKNENGVVWWHGILGVSLIAIVMFGIIYVTRKGKKRKGKK